MLRFTIREQVLLVLIVGVACGWFVDRLAQRRKHAAVYAERDMVRRQRDQLIICVEAEGFRVETMPKYIKFTNPDGVWRIRTLLPDGNN